MTPIYQRKKVQILEHGPSRSAKIFLLLERYFPLFYLPVFITFFLQVHLTSATSNFPQFPSNPTSELWPLPAAHTELFSVQLF